MLAITQLKPDKDQMILTIDKGMVLVVMDRKEYIRKARDLLDDTNTYRFIQSDPINKLKNKLISILKKIKADTGMKENIYRRKHQLRPVFLNSMGFQKYVRTSHWDPYFQVLTLLHIEWPKK